MTSQRQVDVDSFHRLSRTGNIWHGCGDSGSCEAQDFGSPCARRAVLAIDGETRRSARIRRPGCVRRRSVAPCRSPVPPRHLDKTQIKGRSDETALCELVWRADDNATALVRNRPEEQRPQQVVLRPTSRARTLERRREKEVVTIGRGEDCGLVVADENASRHHCTIERRKDKFVLVDLSTNGTYLTVEGEKEVLLQHEEFVLRKRGSITLGTPLVAAADGVEFSVE